MPHDNGTPLIAEYKHSWALIVGINAYQHLPPLDYAVSDARAIAEILSERFNFPAQRIIQLLDEQATREAILSVFDETLTDKDKVTRDDRLLVFFAGHGLTRHGNQGDQGYVAPVDAKGNAWRSLIAMTDLMDLASFVPAKHIFFIMDACYSGLALTRSSGLDAHVQRMLSHEAWQVLTAGKADEEVADGGGPSGANSIFTGHLLDALRGAVIGRDGLLTASYVMSYVYRKLINDPRSNQTPHFGWLRGDGDFVFQKPAVPLLPTPIEVALKHGGIESRVRAVQALSWLSKIDDRSVAYLALNRLERVARLDPAVAVRDKAATALGWQPRKAAAPSSSNVRIQHSASTKTLDHRPPAEKRRQRMARLATAALSTVVAGLGCLVAITSLASARSHQDMQALETLAAEEGQLVATLLADTPTPEEAASDGEASGPESSGGRPSPTPMIALTATATTDSSESEGTLEALQTGTIILTDNFENGENAWEVGEASNTRRVVEQGQLRFFVGSTYALWVSRPDLPSQDDLVFSAEATVLEGDGDFSYGLIFRQVDFDNYYYFLLDNEGQILVVRQLNGLAELIVEPTPLDPDLFQPGEAATRLAVVTTGPDFTFLINGQRIAQVRDTAIASGRVGLAVQTLNDVPAHVAFDDVIIQRPDIQS